MFGKKFDHNDLTNFLPDNHIIGTVSFFRRSTQQWMNIFVKY